MFADITLYHNHHLNNPSFPVKKVDLLVPFFHFSGLQPPQFGRPTCLHDAWSRNDVRASQIGLEHGFVLGFWWIFEAFSDGFRWFPDISSNQWKTSWFIRESGSGFLVSKFWLQFWTLSWGCEPTEPTRVPWVTVSRWVLTTAVRLIHGVLFVRILRKLG